MRYGPGPNRAADRVDFQDIVAEVLILSIILPELAARLICSQLPMKADCNHFRPEETLLQAAVEKENVTTKDLTILTSKAF